VSFSPDNVEKTGVSPGGQSRSPIVAAEAQQVEPTRTKTWSRARSEVFVPYTGRGGAGGRANSDKDLVTGPIRGFCALQAANVHRRDVLGGLIHEYRVAA